MSGAKMDLAAELAEPEAEVLGFNPVVLMDDVVDAAEDYNCDACDKLEKVLLADFESLRGQKVEVGAAVDRFNRFLSDRLASSLEALEAHTRKDVFMVPQGLEVPEKGGDPDPVPPVDSGALDRELEDLRRRLETARFYRALLERESAALDADLSASELVKAEFERLDAARLVDSYAAEGGGDATSGGRVSTVVEQSRALAASFAKLQELVKRLEIPVREAAGSPAGGESSASAFVRGPRAARDLDAFVRSLN